MLKGRLTRQQKVMNSLSESSHSPSRDDLWSMCGVDPMTKSYIASEDHLQSLGLTEDNGIPKFKLNEPCSSLAVSTVCPSSTVEDLHSSQSFVVLSHPSLEVVQQQSLENYVQIQEKTASVDYNSVVSNMTSSEIQHKLSEMLHENLQLKETLVENNEAMKKQFNSLAVWQEEVANVHLNHKQKFVETRELINQLQKENVDLRMQFSVEHPKSNTVVLEKLTESQSLQTSATNFCNCSSREANLVEMLEKVTKELNESRQHCENLSEEVEKYVSLSNLMRLQLKSDSTGMDQSGGSNDFIVLCPSPNKNEEVQTLLKECAEKDKEISFLRELVTSLEQQVQTISKDVFVPIQPFESENTLEYQTIRSEVRQQLIQSVKSYSDKMETLVDCFSVQSSRYVRIQECLKECADILHKFEISNSEAPKKENLVLTTYGNILSECRKKLVDEQLENIADRQKWIKVQDQLQKIFSDYKSALYELEITEEENKKLATIQDNVIEERLQEFKELEKFITEEQKSLAEEASILSLEKMSLADEKKSLDELRETVLATQANLKAELDTFQLEKSALDRQSRFYEALEESLQVEKQFLLKRCEDFKEKIVSLEQQLSKQSALSDTDKENIMVFRAQLEIYRADYEQEKEAKKDIIREKNKLCDKIQDLTEQNQQFRKEIDRLRQQAQRLQPRPSSEPEEQHQGPEKASRTIQLYSCPVCDLKFSSFDPLEEHVEHCMQLIE